MKHIWYIYDTYDTYDTLQNYIILLYCIVLSLYLLFTFQYCQPFIWPLLLTPITPINISLLSPLTPINTTSLRARGGIGGSAIHTINTIHTIHTIHYLSLLHYIILLIHSFPLSALYNPSDTFLSFIEYTLLNIKSWRAMWLSMWRS